MRIVDQHSLESRNQKSGASKHSPLTCRTGGGWKTVHAQVFELAPGKADKLCNPGSRRQTYGHVVLVFRARPLAGQRQLPEMGLAYDRRLLTKQADGALVRLITPVGGDERQARGRFDEFTNHLLSILPQFIQEAQETIN